MQLNSRAVEKMRRPLKRPEYERLTALGAFAGERLELLAGELVLMSPQGMQHVWTVSRLGRLLVKLLGSRAEVRVQAPFAASDDSEPEPDIVVVPPGDYLETHPSTALLVIEVADTTVARDRAKAKLYSRCRVPECWIVNLEKRQVEVFRRVARGKYAQTNRVRTGMLTVLGITIEVIGLFPPLVRH